MTSALVTDLLAVLDQLAGGVHPGFRPDRALVRGEYERAGALKATDAEVVVAE